MSERYEPTAGRLRAGDLLTNLIDFAALLRSDLGFSAGQAEAREALGALAIVGVQDVRRVRDAMRLIFCSKRGEAEVFDQAFDSFFLRPDAGVRQDKYAPRHSRGRPYAASLARRAGSAESQSAWIESAGGRPVVQTLREPSAEKTEVTGAAASLAPAEGNAPVIEAERVRELLPLADKLIASVRLGKLRRWRPQRTGPRFDMRRTLRVSLHTGGDPVSLRYLAHPLRNPRFVVLVDGSRSMIEHGADLLEFAYALSRRSRRTSIFVFSTELRDVTRELRRARHEREHQLLEIGEAWGGGTQIGSSLDKFLRQNGSKLNEQTAIIICSDGLDAGDVSALAAIMRELHRRCAMIIWVNPLADSPAYEPKALGMRAALPSVDIFIGLKDLETLPELARRAS